MIEYGRKTFVEETAIVSKLRQCDHSIMYAYVKGSVNLEEHMSAFEERKTLWNRLSQVDYYYTCSTTFSWEIGFSLWASKYTCRSECVIMLFIS